MTDLTRVMLKVSLVGHTQLPHSLSVAETELRIFRFPGGRAKNFFSDQRLNRVLDFCILWLGTNDIKTSTHPGELFEEIKGVHDHIVSDCGAVVHICQMEPRTYAGETTINSEGYRKVQNSVNKKIKRKLTNRTTHFNAASFVDTLSEDGVHWTGRRKNLNQS